MHIDGVYVLNQITSPIDKFIIIFSVVMIPLILYLMVDLWKMYLNKGNKSTKIIILNTVATLLTLIFVGGLFYFQVTYDSSSYQVIVSNEVSVIDFHNTYELEKIEGQIFTVKLKNKEE